MSEFDMEILHAPSHTNMVLDTLFQCADLVTSVKVNSDLLQQICSLQETDMGKLWLCLKSFADHGGHSFCIKGGLVCHVYPKGGYTVVIPENEELH